MINPSGKFHNKPDSAMIEIEGWMKNLSANGGNYVRIWHSESFWDMEDKQAGQYSEDKIRRIDRFIALARDNHLRIKITLEHFRSLTTDENPQSWATKFVYHTSRGGPLDSIRQYLTTTAGQKPEPLNPAIRAQAGFIGSILQEYYCMIYFLPRSFPDQQDVACAGTGSHMLTGITCGTILADSVKLFAVSTLSQKNLFLHSRKSGTSGFTSLPVRIRSFCDSGINVIPGNQN